MNIHNLKLSKMALLLLTSGAVCLNCSACSKNSINNEVLESSDLENIENGDLSTLESDVEKVSDSSISFYFDNEYAYLNKDSEIVSTDEIDSVIENIEIYQKVQVLKKENGYYLIKYNNRCGYIKDSDINILNDEYIEIDISSQHLDYYTTDKSLYVSSDVVTGLDTKSDRQTVLGYYSIYLKQVNRYLKGKNYKSYVNYWMPFYEGYGLHDATWRSSFGGDIYKTKGSHGCINLPKDVAQKIYEKSRVGTPVLIHE